MGRNTLAGSRRGKVTRGEAGAVGDRRTTQVVFISWSKQFRVFICIKKVKDNLSGRFSLKGI